MLRSHQPVVNVIGDGLEALWALSSWNYGTCPNLVAILSRSAVVFGESGESKGRSGFSAVQDLASMEKEQVV